MLIPIAPDLVAYCLTEASIDYLAQYTGLLIFTTSFINLLVSPWIGKISDDIGRKPIILSCLIALIIENIIILNSSNYWLLLLGRAIAGVGVAYHPTIYAAITDTEDNQKLTKEFGIIEGWFGIGFIVGPLIAALLSNYATTAPFFIMTTWGLVMLLIFYAFFNETAQKTQTIRIKSFLTLTSLNHIMPLKKILAVKNTMGYTLLSFLTYRLSFLVMPMTWNFIARDHFNISTRQVSLSLFFLGTWHTANLSDHST